jgi:hypothetical protein
MGGAEPGQEPGATRREVEADDARVVGVVPAGDEAGGDAAVDQPNHAVVLEHQMVGNVADGGRPAGVAADGEQQLMLRRRKADAVGLFGAPIQELPHGVTERQQAGVVAVGERMGLYIVLR